MHSLLTVTYLGPNLQNILRQSYNYLTIDLRQLSNLQLEGKYSLESTDPCESEIRAPPQLTIALNLSCYLFIIAKQFKVKDACLKFV